MRKIFYIIIFSMLLIPFACRYKDGPLISFRSIQKRLEGKWQVVGYTSNEVDSLQNYNDSCGGYMQISFPSDWDFVNIYFNADSNKPFKGNGGYFYFSDHYTIMNLDIHKTSFKSLGPIGGNTIGNSITTNTLESWKILKLEMKELKISTTFNGRNYLILFNKIS